MADGVKESSEARLSRRATKAKATRDRILGAARALFIAQGYTTTTIAQIADEADVAVQTVYAVYLNKKTILTAILEASVTGDTDVVPLADRPAMRAVRTAPTAPLAVKAFAAFSLEVVERVGAVWQVLVTAAPTDPQLEELLRLSERQRDQDQSQLVDRLRELGTLKSGLTPAKARDLVWVLGAPELYLRLVRDRNWSGADYEAWLADTLMHALVRRTRKPSP